MGKIQYDYEVIFIDVGQGDATLIHQLSNMHSVLVDAGIATPVLTALKQSTQLKAIFVTHWDKDHIGGMSAVINWLSNKYQKAINVFINLQDTSTNSAKRFMRTLDQAYNDGTIIIKPACNDSKDPTGIINGKFLILWPPHAIVITHPEDRNFGSLILRFEVGDFSLLLSGDAGGDVWPLVDQTVLKADVFRYPHHGGELFTGKNSWSADDLISTIALR
ncbi:MAG: MBL fold metallo-hydrolase [Desulfobacterales bacterium]|uniref:MBL fold metallo-hydrolase n=1 Tax=Candidatus Desulfatibia vada TaxID=2841696 RepID=A0A8J6P0H7_9BACT|nr:MBL fold metallo-hydrolase [Candidatus Desulfatibia vada]